MAYAHSLHGWLRSRFFFAVTAVSALSMALFGSWHLTDEPWAGPRLHLNLALAWAPYLCSLLLVALHQQAPKSRVVWWVVFAVWLAFFPNAPYLVTDWLYLSNFREDLWYSIGIFGTISSAGLLLSVTSLYLVHTLMRVRLSPVVSEPMVFLVLLLSGLGVFLGRFVRLNSWDLVTDPRAVLTALAEQPGDPAYHANSLYFSLGVALLLGLCYAVFVSLRYAPRSREELRGWGHETPHRPPQEGIGCTTDDPVLGSLREYDPDAWTPEEVAAQVRRWQRELRRK
jgi:uncharacterized membrane protein